MVTYYPFGLGISPPAVLLMLMFLIAGVHSGVNNNNNTTAVAAAAEAEANNNNNSLSSSKWVNGGDVSVLYKWCGEQEAADEDGFVRSREEALAELLTGDHMEGTAALGWRMAEVEGIRARGLCGDRLSWPDCTDCISVAGKQITMACPHSVRARLFADGCFVSYDYNPPLEPDPSYPLPHPFPHPPPPPPSPPPPHPPDDDPIHFTTHTVALILGAVALVLLLLVLCLCLKFQSRRCDD